MAEDKVKVSGKSPGIWSVRIDNKWIEIRALPKEKILEAMDFQDFTDVEIKAIINGKETVQVMDLGTTYTVTFRIRGQEVSETMSSAAATSS